MRVLKTRQTWKQVLQALHAGRYANHATWVANKPTKAPEFVGPTALALVKRPGEKYAFSVVTDTGVAIHGWNPSPEEFSSSEWQIVEIEAKVLIVDVPAPPAPALPVFPMIHHDQSDPRSPIPVSGPQSRPPRRRAG